MYIKIVFGLIAILIAFISYAPYIRDMHKGKTKPHAYSWFIWALIGYIAGFAQLKSGGGAGAWVSILSATIMLYIAVVAYLDGSIKFTKSDKLSLGAALIAIPLWVVTKQPLLAVILVSAIDATGFWPTLRKSYHVPHQETLSNYWLAAIKNIIAIAALQKYSLITLIYPASLVLTDGLCFILLVIRLRQLALGEET